MGNVEESEMYQVFNMGIGMVVICSSKEASFAKLQGSLQGAIKIGKVIKATEPEKVIIS